MEAADSQMPSNQFLFHFAPKATEPFVPQVWGEPVFDLNGNEKTSVNIVLATAADCISLRKCSGFGVEMWRVT